MSVTLSEYLTTSFRPDREFVDGCLLERNVGEWDHSRLQVLLSGYLGERERQRGILVALATRVRVAPNCVRVPDITVIVGLPPEIGIVTQPPFLCVEILSPNDRMAEMQERIEDYLAFGVRCVWLINPRNRWAWIHTAAGVHEVTNGVLTTTDPDIRVPLSELG